MQRLCNKCKNTWQYTFTIGALVLGQASCTTNTHDRYGTLDGRELGPEASLNQANFDRVDDGNGLLDWTEVSEAYEEELTELGWGEDEVFRRFDRNSNGFFDRYEYERFIDGLKEQLGYADSSGQDAVSIRQNGYFLFDDVDIDNDGLVGSEEFGDAGLTGEFGIFDENADGFLQEDEFDTFMEELGITSGNRTEPKTPAAKGFSFSAVDADNDGFVDGDELDDAGINVELRYRLFDNNEDGVLDEEEFTSYVSTLAFDGFAGSP